MAIESLVVIYVRKMIAEHLRLQESLNDLDYLTAMESLSEYFEEAAEQKRAELEGETA